MTTEAADLEKFLKQVDQISELVKEMNSNDAVSQQRAAEKADQLISAFKESGEADEPCETRLNRTVINNKPERNEAAPCGLRNDADTCQENFMKLLEKDAQERSERRKENEMLANALKEMGNEAFAKGDYETAVQRYSEGLEKLRDMQVLYTNRAQAYIKLEKYKEAVNDCEWALKCNEKCLKAYVHMGRANLALKNYEEAHRCYQKILEIDPKQERLVKDYTNQVYCEEKKNTQEKKALEEFEQGKENATSVLEVLQKLAKPDQVNLYYAGGVRLLTERIKDCTEQTLFRINNGFSIINSNTIVQRSLSVKSQEPFNDELCISVLILWQAVCKGNEENQQLLMQWAGITECLIELLASEKPGIQKECVALVLMYSLTEHGRALLLRNLDQTKLLERLMGYMHHQDFIAANAVGIMANLAAEKKFRVQFRPHFATAVMPHFITLLRNLSSANRSVLPQCISTVSNMAGDEGIRKQLADSEECWEACLVAMDGYLSSSKDSQHRDIAVALLGLMLNLSLERNTVIQGQAVNITARCVTLLCCMDGDIITKTTRLLSHILPQSNEAVDEAVKAGTVKKMFKFLKAGGQVTVRYAVMTLAVCTKQSRQASEELVKLDRKFCTLVKLQSVEDELIVGNAVLCLSQCMDVPGAATALLNSDIVKILLKHAGGDARKTTVQQNAAIALGKLCTAEPRHLSQLRQLHGLEILNSCMKHIK